MGPRPDEPIHETVPLSRASIDELRSAFVARPMLVASHAGGAEWLPLEEGTSLVVGRTSPSDLVVKNPHLSRCHARFTLDGDRLEVVDLGSHNGTVIRGARVTRAVLNVGEVALLGRVRVSLQRLERGDDATLPGHEAWCGRVADEISRASFFRRPFAVLHVRAADESRLAEGWLPFVRSLLRPVDRVALYGPHAAWALLPEATRDEARRVARAVVGARQTHGQLFVGVSAFPDAKSLESLTDEARSAARRAGAAQPVVDSSDATTVPPRSARADDAVVAESASMRAVLGTLARVAPSELPVLLLGETGSGKEVAARLLHEKSPRRDKPLVPVNCGALPAHLVESTLFGHEKGSFTGAVGLHKGVFEAAAGGTVFLDEVGELPAPAQAALLRVLEAKRISRVGATQELPVDVRIVAATHRDLEEMVVEGRFRQDLLFRLETITLKLPPLRERKDDILPLARAMLLRATSDGNQPKALSSEARDAVLAYAWPGNVRELKNAMDRASVVGFGDHIALEDLPDRLLRAHRAAPGPSSGPSSAPGSLATPEAATARALLLNPPTFTDSPTLDLRTRLARFESAAVLDALKASGGKQAAAAELLGLPLRTLKYKLAAITKRRD